MVNGMPAWFSKCISLCFRSPVRLRTDYILYLSTILCKQMTYLGTYNILHFPLNHFSLAWDYFCTRYGWCLTSHYKQIQQRWTSLLSKTKLLRLFWKVSPCPLAENCTMQCLTKDYLNFALIIEHIQKEFNIG